MMSDEAEGDLDPTRPIEVLPDGRLRYYLYGQDGQLIPMSVEDTEHYRRFIVWTRKFDRYGPSGREVARLSPPSNGHNMETRT